MKIVKESVLYQKGNFGLWYKRLFKLSDEGVLLGYKNSRLETTISIVGKKVLESEDNFIFIIYDDNNANIITLREENEIQRQEWIDNIKLFQERNGYKILKMLQKGSFAKVFLCNRDTSQAFAMKIMNVAGNRNQFDLEDSLMCTIKHPFLMTAYDSFKTNNAHCIVMKFMVGGDLSTYLETKVKLTEDETRFYGAEIVSALIYLHELNIVHRDVKLANLLMDENGHIILGDYGLSAKIESCSQLTEMVGTPAYMAPEMFCGAYDFAVDWWSVGVILYRMMIGKFPPWQMKKPEDLSGLISKVAEQILMAFLEKSPVNRLGSSPSGHEDIRGHQFFDSIDWNKLQAMLLSPPFIPNSKPQLTRSSIFTDFVDYIFGIFSRLR